MKKQFTPLLLVAIAALAISFTACKSKPKDADIKAEVEKVLAADPMAMSTAVSVEKGVATISGECKDDMCKAHCADIVGKVKGVTSVVNNCTVAAPPPPPTVANTDTDMLTKALADALKDQPGLKGSVVDGKIVLAGEIAKAKWVMVKQTLDKLKAAGYDLTGLKIK
jgi:hyperosmotically inducible periplasmic protein